MVGLELFNGSDYGDADAIHPAGSYGEALDKGWHVGAVGAEDTHDTDWGLPVQAQDRDPRAGADPRRPARRAARPALLRGPPRGHPHGLHRRTAQPMGSTLAAAPGRSARARRVERRPRRDARARDERRRRRGRPAPARCRSTRPASAERALVLRPRARRGRPARSPTRARSGSSSRASCRSAPRRSRTTRSPSPSAGRPRGAPRCASSPPCRLRRSSVVSQITSPSVAVWM